MSESRPLWEVWRYITEDGYINTVFRVAGSALDGPQAQKPVIIFNHGLSLTSDIFLADGEHSIALVFARAGFDVWLNNNRGNRYSQLHRHLDAETDAAYWDFSFQEMGTYDQRALFEYVLKETGVSKVTYFGFSQGTTQMFVALAEDTEYYRQRVNLFMMAGPAARWDETIPSLVTTCFAGLGKLDKFTKGYYMPGPRVTRFLVGSGFTKVITKVMTDADTTTLGEDAHAVYSARTPGGSSPRSFTHFSQLQRARKFKKFDFQEAGKNREHYGQDTPPEISLTAYRDVPIALLCGRQDRCISQQCYKWVADTLRPNGNLVAFKEYDVGHMGLLFPRDRSIIGEYLALARQYQEDPTAIEVASAASLVEGSDPLLKKTE